MKKVFLILLVLAAFTSMGFIGLKAWDILNSKFRYFWMENKIEEDDLQDILHIYDPQNKIPEKLEHYRLQLKGDSDWEIEKNELDKASANLPVLLTVEIWEKRALNSLSAGAYDQKMEELFKSLAHQENLYLRFNPEMEIPQNENPWSNWGHVYVKAFQKFSEMAKEFVPEAEVVWAPAGALGNMEYYPGEEFFDVASISLGKRDETDLFLKDKNSREILERKLHRMRFLNVPIIVLDSEIDSAGIKTEALATAFQKYEKAKKVTNLDDLSPKNGFRRKAAPKMGVYDPEELLVGNDGIDMEHIFIGFHGIQNGTFQKAFAAIAARGHDVIITLEPGNLTENPVEPNVLKSILQGNYDDLLQKFYAAIPENGPMVYLRFAHEMEIPVDRYSWQKQDPMLYIRAFRYFMEFPGSGKENIKKVWSPAGDRGSIDWWPGSDIVDYISISIYGLPDKNITDHTKQESFGEIYRRKHSRLDLFGKPFLIAEFGVKGDEEYQKQWLIHAADVINKNKEIFGVSYFNQQDVPKAWGEIQPPDWSITPEVFTEFTEAVKKQQ